MLALRSANLVIVSSVMSAAAIAFVELRSIVRPTWKARVGLDDYLIVLGLILALGIAICTIVGAAKFRFGDHELYNTSGPLEGFPLAWLLLGYGKIFYAIRILHCCTMPAIKISLLLFWNRLFGQITWMKFGIRAIGIYVIAWWLVTLWMTIFQCWPISYHWRTYPAQMGKCIPNYKLWYAWAALLNVLSDIAVTILPIPIIARLQVSVRKRVGILAIPSTAAAVIIASIGRTVSYFKNDRSFDFTYSNYDFLMWTVIEPPLGIISVCAIPLGRLTEVQKFAWYQRVRSTLSLQSLRSRWPSHSESQKQRDDRSSSPDPTRTPYSEIEDKHWIQPEIPTEDLRKNVGVAAQR